MHHRFCMFVKRRQEQISPQIPGIVLRFWMGCNRKKFLLFLGFPAPLTSRWWRLVRAASLIIERAHIVLNSKLVRRGMNAYLKVSAFSRRIIQYGHWDHSSTSV